MLPSFLIVGAAKSGTGSLSYILNQSSSIFRSEQKELMFFDKEDFKNSINFILEYPTKYKKFDWGENKNELIKEYEKNFEDARKDQLLFEATPSYMASEKAPKRISKTIENVQLIFIMRDPVDRAYSQYWHHVRAGRAIYGFRNQIKYESPYILEMGRYKSQIERYLRYFSKDQMKFIIFENFIKNTQKQVNSVLDFLEVDDELNLNEIKSHKNPSRVPRFIKPHLFFNFLNRTFLDMKHTSPLKADINIDRNKLFLLLESAVNKFNLSPDIDYPKMKKEDREFLEEFYRRENKGLSDLIDEDVSEYWEYMS